MPFHPDMRLRDLKYAVVDLETTGLIAGKDRVLEIAVCHVDQDGPPRVVFSSLVNPGRAVTGTEIHGLTSVDIADAPLFSQLSTELANALLGRLIVGYNVDYDLSFLAEEWRLLGFSRTLPHICALRLRSGLGRGWQTLGDACAAEGVPVRKAHSATYDALATAELLHKQLAQLAEQEVTTLQGLRDKWNYSFTKSLALDPLGESEIPPHPSRATLPRTAFLRAASDVAVYQNAVMVALADLRASEEELRAISELRTALGLPADFVRAVHARVFAMYLVMTAGDERLAPAEAADIHKLRNCLSVFGWAPGDAD